MCSQLCLLQCAIWLTITLTSIWNLIYSPAVAFHWYIAENDASDLPVAGCLFLLNLAWVILMGCAIHKRERNLYKISFFVSWVPFGLAVYRLISYVYYGQSIYEEFFQGWTETAISNLSTVLVFLNIVYHAIPLVSFGLLWKNSPDDDRFRCEKVLLV